MTRTAPFTVVEASLADLAAALDDGTVTSVDLVARYLTRIAHFDRSGITLNALVVLDPAAFAEARASDDRRRAGIALGPLDGIPYTAKDSYRVRGLTVAAGSPAFRDLIAGDDAFTIARLRSAGAVLIGLTNMPPMANGGMQRGLYGRAESPYNAGYLTAAFASGSSNGSGTATAASFAAFGLGEETWSSGRAPASNNGLVAYTPSRGVISVRGNWPLVPTMDVVVPHTRSTDDLLTLLDTIVADDPDTRGDFWRAQPWVPLPRASEVRPASYRVLETTDSLRGRRLGIPRLYTNRDDGARSPIETRASVVDLWERARADLESLGAEVVEVDLPMVSNYEGDRPGAPTLATRGFVPPQFLASELWQLSMFAWHDFLASTGDPALDALADVDGALISPTPSGALTDRYGMHQTDPDADVDLADYVTRARSEGITPLDEIPFLEEGLRGLERTRRVDLEDWLDGLGIDALVFPAVADVGPADADVDPASAALAWRNGTWVANGNLVLRHLGIPTVTVPMGVMADTGMPVGLTFAGRAYDDTALLSYAAAYEHACRRRAAPGRTPALDDEAGLLAPFKAVETAGGAVEDLSLTLDATTAPVPAGLEVDITVTVALSSAPGNSAASRTAPVPVPAAPLTHAAPGSTTVADPGSGTTATIRASVNGAPVPLRRTSIPSDRAATFSATTIIPAAALPLPHSEWSDPHAPLVVVTLTVGDTVVAGAFATAEP